MKIKNNLLYGKAYVEKVKNQIQFVKHSLEMVSWRMNVNLMSFGNTTYDLAWQKSAK